MELFIDGPIYGDLALHVMQGQVTPLLRNQMYIFLRQTYDPFRFKPSILFILLPTIIIIATRASHFPAATDALCSGQQFYWVLNAIDGDGPYNSIMSEICSKVQTRGRPRKNADERLPPISRKLFSEHCAVFYACCMVYVLEVFLKTKQEKRIGHSEGGFTIYEKLNAQYCFESLEEDVKEWGFWEVMNAHPALWDFVKTVNGCAPKFVFRELVVLIVGICEVIAKEEISSIQELDLSQTTFMNASEGDLNRLFKYIRFSPAALKELRIEKWSLQVNKKIKELWRPFLKIVSYTVFCVLTGEDKSKYLKPFFSDAEHPEETIIGQLNLEQIVEEKEERPSPPNLGFTKIAKSQEELFDPAVKKLSFDNSPSVSERMPLMNRRPITLITFPSNTKIQLCNSPTKLAQGHSANAEEAIEQLQPGKKLKTE